ncbi:MAG: Gfo/Idh/MocA family oxidoreductase [Planctomycetia bacterium]|nr:Gfo/Idh/MocA family oxidoreductase [Planctomycetia bacterium]
MKKMTRRDFAKTGLAAGAVMGGLSVARSAHANGGTEVLKVGLVGCGGRGTGAAHNALNADPNTKIVAIGDLFKDRLANCAKNLKETFGDRAPLTEADCFDGFDNYKQVIEKCDVVLLCSTPHYRPIHLRAAVEAGKHVFFEKPVAVDPTGIRSVLESSRLGKEKGLTMVCGLCWRYHTAVQETMARVLGGEIGDLLAIQETYLTGKLWTRPRQEGDTEMAFQNRNWYNFTWLSGDFNVEQHVHSLDKALWAMGDQPPVDAWGVGGRMVRVEQPAYGDIYDLMGVTYNYPNGVKVHAFCRQQNGCYNDTSDQFIGTKGTANILGNTISDLKGKVVWKYRGPGCDMYTNEHKYMFRSIRSGEARNDGTFGAYSTMLGILGRECCYTGKKITWEEIMNSQQNLAPTAYAMDGNPPTLPDENGHYLVALPGTGNHSI